MMVNLRRLLPSLDALVLFEAAARIQNFTRAARELGVSQAAVSYAIKQLEGTLGVTLFLRRHRAVELTKAGERFYNDVAIGLRHIQRSAESLHQSVQPSHVTLSVSTAFASHWMLPRLAHLRQDLPDVDLRLQTSDRDVDLVAEGIALGIRRGTGNWEKYDAAPFADDVLFAVAAPSYLKAMGLPNWSEGIEGHVLIHLEEPYRSHTSWADWFDALGIPHDTLEQGLRLNDYALVVQAAMEGEGIALGWNHITQLLLETGYLIKVTDAEVQTSYGFYVVWPKHTPMSPQAARVRDWLLQEVLRVPGRFGPTPP